MDADRQARARSGAGVMLGMAVMGIGLLFLLDNLGLVEARNWLQYWPALLILVGLQKALQPRNCGWRGEGVVWILVGAWLLFDRLGLPYLRFRNLWPLLVILVGARLLWRALHPLPRGSATDQDSIVNGLAVMGGIERANNSSGFRGGQLSAIMGGVDLDLTKAQIDGDQAVIDVFVIWGGIDIQVPEGWSVRSTTVPIMGGFDDATTPPAEPGPRLLITGIVIMGGVEVNNGRRSRKR